MKKSNIYDIKVNNKKDKEIRIIIIAIMFMILVALSITIFYVINIINGYNEYKEYEEELITRQEEEEKKQIELVVKNEEKKKIERIPKLTDKGKENLQGIYNSDEKRVFLTFDDGPSSVTPQILDTLKAEDIKATFFVLGTGVEALPETTKRIYDEGHFLANHGYSHVYSSIYASPEAVLQEFNRCNDAVKTAIGVPEYNSHLFRFPGGFVGGPYANVKNQAKEILLQNNILNIDWNCLTGDSETTNPTVEFEIQRLQETSKGKNSLIILMHDAQAKKATAEALPQIIQYLKNEGYEFKNFYEIIK